MGLGIFASCAAIPKFLAVRRLHQSGDWTWEAGQIDMWSLLEMSLGILATSNIALKGLLEKTLRRLGILPMVKYSQYTATTEGCSSKSQSSRGMSGMYGESTDHVIPTEHGDSTGDSMEFESQEPLPESQSENKRPVDFGSRFK
jgi:hypothetical protein